MLLCVMYSNRSGIIAGRMSPEEVGAYILLAVLWACTVYILNFVYVHVYNILCCAASST